MITRLNAEPRVFDVPGLGPHWTEEIFLVQGEDIKRLLEGWTLEIEWLTTLWDVVEIWSSQAGRVAIERKVLHGYSECIVYTGFRPCEDYCWEDMDYVFFW